MSAPVLPVRNLGATEITFGARTEERTLASSGRAAFPADILLSQEFAAALLAGKVALVVPVAPTAEQLRLGALVAAALLPRLGPALIEMNERALAARSALARLRLRYNVAWDHAATLTTEAHEAGTSAASLGRLAEAFLATPAEDAEIARLDAEMAEVAATLTEEASAEGVERALGQWEELRMKRDEVLARQRQIQAEMDEHYGRIVELLVAASSSMTAATKDDLGQKASG